MNDYAYITDGEGGLFLIEVSDPLEPFEVGYFDTPGTSWDVFVVGNLAYLADGGEGLRIIDISIPEEPLEVGYYNTTGHSKGVFVLDKYAYLTDGDLHILDISDPTNPVEVGFYDAPYYTQGVAVEGSLVYVAAGYDGLLIIKNDLVGITEHHLQNVNQLAVTFAPNPAVEIISISCNLPEKCNISIELYQQNGRLVQEIIKNNQLAGPNKTEVNIAGLPSGSYLYLITAEALNDQKVYKEGGKMIVQ